MRLFLSAALLALSAANVQAADIRVFAPGFVYNSALKELAADFTKQTGVNVIVTEVGMNVIINQIKTSTPAADVVALPSDLMNTLALDGGIVTASYTPLGRDELGLAVKKGAPKPIENANMASAPKPALWVLAIHAKMPVSTGPVSNCQPNSGKERPFRPRSGNAFMRPRNSGALLPRSSLRILL